MLDYLIIGFGLGGMHLAHCLDGKNQSFIILNDESQKASKVAGGLCNPVALNKFSLIPNGIKNLQIATETYKSLEQKLGTKVLFPMSIHQKFTSEEEQNKWLLASKEQNSKSFLNSNLIPIHEHIPSEYQFGEVMRSYLIRIPELLNSFAKYLREKKQYISTHFDHTLLEINQDYIAYKDIRARKIIFCEGFGLKQNIFFNYLPLLGNKGEYLIVHAPKLKLKETIKSTYFLIPMGNNHYKFGATYEREFDHQEPTETAQNKLVSALDELIDCPYSIIDQVAGIRPTTSDHKPLVGQHPEYSNLYICNGFGSRGILNAPSLTQELVAFIENKTPLSPEINIDRFRKKYVVQK